LPDPRRHRSAPVTVGQDDGGCHLKPEEELYQRLVSTLDLGVHGGTPKGQGNREQGEFEGLFPESAVERGRQEKRQHEQRDRPPDDLPESPLSLH